MTQFQTRQVVVDGVRSPVLIGGANAGGDAIGEAVVFVHGNPGLPMQWAHRIVEHLPPI
ncbi:MAG TPA: hypothetical protein VME67_05435 [Mycobacterium sp.]|nr:hypothetical protein [Mycobacterium sp.]HTX94316.1 hypothetical protein [Mycobacterium sp.]